MGQSSTFLPSGGEGFSLSYMKLRFGLERMCYFGAMRKTTLQYALALVLLAVFVFVTGRGWLESQEVKVLDLFFRNRPIEQEPYEDLLLIEVTDACIREMDKWPWPRSRMARMVEAAVQGGAKVVGCDILFDDPSSDEAEDQAMAEVVRRAGNVVLACELEQKVVWDNERGEPVPRLFVRRPIPDLSAAARRLGLVNVDYFFQNVDGIIRQMPIAKEVDGRFVSTLGLALASVFLDTDARQDKDGIWLRDYHIPVFRTPYRSKGVSESQRLLHQEYASGVLLNYASQTVQGHFVRLSARSVLKGKYDPEVFRGKVVLIGVNDGKMDLTVTPFGLMAGMEVQANLVRNLLQRNLLRRIPRGLHLILLIFASMFGAWGLIRFPARRAVPLLLLFVLLWVAISFWAFSVRGRWIDVVPVVLQAVVQLAALKLLSLSIDLGRRIRNLENLNLLSRRFNATLDLEGLRGVILDTYLELGQAGGGAIAICGADPDKLELRVDDGLPEAMKAGVEDESLRRRLRDAVGDRLEPMRLDMVPDAEGLLQAGAGGASMLLPLVHHEVARGWVLLWGEALSRRLLDPEEGDFWGTLGAVAFTSLDNARLYKLATVDGLTGLYVRHFFDVSIEREFRRAFRYDGSCAILITDIDHFKGFNDTYGHQMGDEVLRKVADCVKGCVRMVDIPCRYGGEEFSIILPETELEGARLIAERIRQRIEEMRVTYEGQTVSVTISIGLSCISLSKAQSAEQFIAEADEALYVAKENGRNKVCCYGIDKGEEEGAEHGQA